MADKILQIRNLQVTFDTPFGQVFAVRGVDLDVEAGELLGVVGESGSGKSVTFLAAMGLLSSSLGISCARGRRTYRQIFTTAAFSSWANYVDDLSRSTFGTESCPSRR